MDSQNATRGITDEKSTKESDFEFYLKHNVPTNQVVAIMRSQGKDRREIDAFVEKYDVAKKRISKLIKKFIEKIESKYGFLDVPELIKKGIKFATKHNFSPAEREAFIRYVLKGESHEVQGMLTPYSDLGRTEMAKFMGFTGSVGPVLDIKATDQSTLNEIARLYELTRPLHAGIKNNLATYRDCAPEAVTGTFSSERHNLHLFVHPVVVALFIPKIETIEKKMLYTNLGRMVVQKALPYLRKYTVMTDSYLPNELNYDLELSLDIASDPNSMTYFGDDTPILNLLKRFRVQIELWKNVLAVRNGRYYSKGDFDSEDGISGFMKILNSYEWTYFDSPDMYQIQDEGTVLRKLLAVFSMRPSFIQTTSIMHHFSGLGMSNVFNVSRSTFFNVPIINVKLPTNPYGGSYGSVNLQDSLSQADWFIENRTMVPKNKTVYFSRGIIFFYANRRHQTLNVANITMGFNYICLPQSQPGGLTQLNETEIAFPPDYSLRVGNELFKLRSVVCVSKPQLEGYVTLGCTTIIRQSREGSNIFWIYDPLSANIINVVEDEKFQNTPFSVLEENSGDDSVPGFVQEARQRGTIFVYSHDTDETATIC